MPFGKKSQCTKECRPRRWRGVIQPPHDDSRHNKGRRDANEPEIVAALESYGYQAYGMDRNDPFDLLVYGHGLWVPCEVKQPIKSKRLTASEAKFRDEARAGRRPYMVLRTAEHCEQLVNGVWRYERP